jgi:hypothetical protein
VIADAVDSSAATAIKRYPVCPRKGSAAARDESLDSVSIAP